MAGDNGIQYEDDDERRAQLLKGLIHPIANGGGDPDAYQVAQNNPPGQPGSQDYNGPKLIPRNAAAPPPPSQPSSPATAPATGDGSPKSWKDYVRSGLAGNLRNTQAAEQSTQAMATQPSEADTVAPIMAKRDAMSQPLDPNAQEYKPSLGQKILRGVKSVATGIAEGGVVGGVAAGLDTDYKAPNRQYGIDSANRQARTADLDKQVSAAQKAYEDATARAKANATQQLDVAKGYNDITTGAEKQQGDEAAEVRDAETARHNQQDELLKSQQQTQTANNEKANLQIRNKEVGIQGGRLSLEQKKQEFEMAQKLSPGGDENIRQPLIDQATASLQEFKDGYAYQPDTGQYVNQQTQKIISPAQYIDKLNEFGANLDQKLAAKKQPPLGLRYKGGPNGQEIPVQTPQTQPKADAPQKPRPEKGSTITVDGKPHQVVGFNEKTGKVIVAP